MNATEKNIASHVAAIASVVVAVLAAWHPGIRNLPDAGQISSFATVVAGVIESINTFFHSSNAAKLTVVKALTAQAVADAQPKVPVLATSPVTTVN